MRDCAGILTCWSGESADDDNGVAAVEIDPKSNVPVSHDNADMVDNDAVALVALEEAHPAPLSISGDANNTTENPRLEKAAQMMVL